MDNKVRLDVLKKEEEMIAEENEELLQEEEEKKKKVRTLIIFTQHFNTSTLQHFNRPSYIYHCTFNHYNVNSSVNG